MAEDGTPPVKRARYGLRDSKTLKQPHNVRYMLRSVAASTEIEHIQLEPKRKRRNMKLLALNSDCLLKIFEYLKPNDLCKIAEACDTLYSLAKYHFRLKYKHFDFATMIGDGFVHMELVEKVLHYFGDQIYSLNISRDLFVTEDDDISTKLLLLVNRYCRHIMKELTLEGLHIPLAAVRASAPIFKSIEKLTLENCSINSNVGWFDFNNLKILKMVEVDGSWPTILQARFGKLEEIQLKGIEIFDDYLIDFIDSNPTLKRLSIVRCFVSTSVFGAIASLKNLETLEFQLNRRITSEERFQSDCLRLLSLKHLKVLKLNCNSMSVLGLLEGFVANGIAIEHLELADGPFDYDLSKAIAKLNALKVLKMNEMIGSQQHISSIKKELQLLEELHIKTAEQISHFRIMEIVRKLNRLTRLKIDSMNFELNGETYREILATVQKRIDQTPLEITIYGDDHQLMISDAVLKDQHQKWLQVKKLNRGCNHLFPLYEWNPDDDDDDFDLDDFAEDDLDFFDEINLNGENLE